VSALRAASIAELEDEALILPRRDTPSAPSRSLVEHLCAQAGFAPCVVYELDDPSLIQHRRDLADLRESSRCCESRAGHAKSWHHHGAETTTEAVPSPVSSRALRGLTLQTVATRCASVRRASLLAVVIAETNLASVAAAVDSGDGRRLCLGRRSPAANLRPPRRRPRLGGNGAPVQNVKSEQRADAAARRLRLPLEVLERISAVDPTVRVVDTHPLAANDPNGLDLFYRMLVATIIGFITVFQVLAQARGLLVRHHAVFVLGRRRRLARVHARRRRAPAGIRRSDPEQCRILALHLLAVASFTSLMAVLIGRWAILPTWLLFVILGNTSSGGAVAPPLLPPPFAFISQWLPSGATVTALRDAVYFGAHQHARPILVLAAWTTALFVAWLLIARRREAGPAPP
jgi:hypothetical protein